MGTITTLTVPADGPDFDALALPQPYLLFLGDTREPGFAKTAFGLRDWAPERCVGEFTLPEAEVSTGLIRMTPAEAQAAGARAMVIGVANPGGGDSRQLARGTARRA